VFTAANLTVLQREFSHDVISIVLDNLDDDATVFQTGIPVEVRWGVESAEVSTINGYVHHTEPISVQGIGRVTKLKLVCIGASFVMNQPARRVWQKRTASSIVRALADSQKFSGHIQEHKQVWESLTQDGSDWNFLVSLAQRIGWTFYVDNTDVYFRQPLYNLPLQLETAPYFVSTGPQNPATGVNNVQTFHVVSGETTPDGGQKAVRYMAGVDPRSGDQYSMSVVPAFGDQLGSESTVPVFDNYESEPMVNYGEAAANLVGTALANRWHIQAKLEANGNARVRPGMLIALIGVGQRHSGYWYVQGIEHDLSVRGYTLHATLGRDSEFNRFGKPRTRARSVIPPRTTPYGTIIGETPPAIFVGNRWRAAYSPRSYGAG
jgi:hypothetical protein